MPLASKCEEAGTTKTAFFQSGWDLHVENGVFLADLLSHAEGRDLEEGAVDGTGNEVPELDQFEEGRGRRLTRLALREDHSADFHGDRGRGVGLQSRIQEEVVAEAIDAKLVPEINGIRCTNEATALFGGVGEQAFRVHGARQFLQGARDGLSHLFFNEVRDASGEVEDLEGLALVVVVEHHEVEALSVLSHVAPSHEGHILLFRVGGVGIHGFKGLPRGRQAQLSQTGVDSQQSEKHGARHC